MMAQSDQMETENQYFAKIAGELGCTIKQVSATVALLDDQATIPFIARYRKEATGCLDEVAITAIRDRLAQLRELNKRRRAILNSLEERGLLDDELKDKLLAAESMAVLEDIYLPFRPKRRTRASTAVERGLQPLAEILLAQDDIDPVSSAEAFIDADKEVHSVEEALAGARDIIAGWISEDVDVRARVRELFRQKGVIKSNVISGKESSGTKFSDYFEWEESIGDLLSHRFLAMRRGESESVLSLRIEPPEEEALKILEASYLAGDNAAAEQVKMAVNDCYKRLLAPAMETEMRSELKERADQDAIKIFTDNLRELLMAPPLGRKRIMAIDPGFRTGCKIVCLDRQGKLDFHTAIYPHGSEGQRHDAEIEVKALCEKYKINVIAVGNGTAGRETETFLRELGLPEHITIERVDESGASIYSVSDTAREEFPDYDATVRGAVSIGRRLMDPLAELVKIDPKSIGVGQYQHDVDQAALRQALDDTVTSCVNAVGVEVNTASRQLLAYVSGLGPKMAENIVSYRNEFGPFKSRRELRKVPRLGPKVYEQAAGFLRIADAENPLDRTAVHPESYAVVQAMASDLGCTIEQLINDETARDRIDLNKYISDKIGLPSLQDIMNELAQPARDPRPDYEPFRFDDSISSIDDLRIGMRLPGIVTNVTAFGAFVDIGVHQDGLVHISEMGNRFVKTPSRIVKVHQRVMVTVIGIDRDRNRIALSMREKRPA
jgi:uncharacterized protein